MESDAGSRGTDVKLLGMLQRPSAAESIRDAHARVVAAVVEWRSFGLHGAAGVLAVARMQPAAPRGESDATRH